jgi:hypothetical protein
VDRGSQQRLRQGEDCVLEGRDARDDVGGGRLDRLGHRRVDVRWLGVQFAVDRAHPVVLVVEALVEALQPGDELAVERAQGGGQAVEGGRDPCHARLVLRADAVQPKADLLQRACDRPFFDHVVVNRAREQFAHPVSGRVLPVIGGRGGLAGAQQQVVVAWLIHLAPSCAPAGGVRPLYALSVAVCAPGAKYRAQSTARRLQCPPCARVDATNDGG